MNPWGCGSGMPCVGVILKEGVRSARKAGSQELSQRELPATLPCLFRAPGSSATQAPPSAPEAHSQDVEGQMSQMPPSVCPRIPIYSSQVAASQQEADTGTSELSGLSQ